VDLYLLSQKNTVYTNKKLINLTEFIQNLSASSETRLWFQRRRDCQRGESVGGAVRDSEGNVVATIGISVPTFELPNSKIKRTAKVVRETAREVSRQLGWEDTQE